nr:hypothetical protein CFP56_01930 [Quercus suber]
MNLTKTLIIFPTLKTSNNCTANLGIQQLTQPNKQQITYHIESEMKVKVNKSKNNKLNDSYTLQLQMTIFPACLHS